MIGSLWIIQEKTNSMACMSCDMGNNFALIRASRYLESNSSAYGDLSLMLFSWNLEILLFIHEI